MVIRFLIIKQVIEFFRGVVYNLLVRLLIAVKFSKVMFGIVFSVF